MTLLKITFQKEDTEEILNIYYELLENSVVTKFINLINDINSQKFVETRYNNICINTGNLNEIKDFLFLIRDFFVQ